MLHGTGTAWFDNVRWECLEAGPAEGGRREVRSEWRWPMRASMCPGIPGRRARARRMRPAATTIASPFGCINFSPQAMAAQAVHRRRGDDRRPLARRSGRVPGHGPVGQTDPRQLSGRSAAAGGRRARPFRANLLRLLARRPGLPAAYGGARPASRCETTSCRRSSIWLRMPISPWAGRRRPIGRTIPRPPARASSSRWRSPIVPAWASVA